jgi:deoxyhypusine synthase
MHVVFGFVKLCQTTSGSETEEAINVTKEEKENTQTTIFLIYRLNVTKSGHLKYLFMPVVRFT